jgi:hypothetical protein
MISNECSLISFYYVESCKIVEYKYFVCSNVYNKLYCMHQVFVISCHGSMPVVDDEFKLPEFNHFSKPHMVKKTISKKPVDKKPVVKKPVVKNPVVKNPVDKNPVIKVNKTVSKKPGTVAKTSSAPSAGLFAAPSAGLFPAKASPAAAKAHLKGLFADKAPSAGLFETPAPSAGLFPAKASPAAAKAHLKGLFADKAPSAGLFETPAPSAGLFPASAGLFAAIATKAPSAAAKASSAAAPSSPPSAAFSVTLGTKPKFKKPVSFTSPVDIFTTAKCGRPFCSSLLCDPPYVDLVRFLSENPHAKGTKDEVRQLVEDAMVRIRGEPRHAKALTQAENRIRCHKQGSNMTELFLFGPSLELPIVESVSMVDLETGDVRDVHEMFGLVDKKVVRSASSNTVLDPEEMMEGLQAKATAELELKELLKMPDVNPFYVDMKRAHIQTIDDTIAGELKESKFEYSPELKKKYGERVKLSDLLKIGISTGLVEPDNDSVVVYACRVPDEQVMQFRLPSPRGNESDASVGGGSKTRKHKAKKSRCKTCKHKRMKR